MPVHTLYITNTTAITPNWFSILQDGGSAPSATNTSYGFLPATLGICQAHLGATGPSTTYQGTSYIDSATGPIKGTGSGPSTAGDSFISGPFSGNVPNTAWTFNFNVRGPGATSGSYDGNIRMRVWKSANADGSAATELTTSTLSGSAVHITNTTSDFNSSISWSPGVLFLSNEYLFFQIEWNATTDPFGSVLFRAGTASIVTPDIGTIVTTTGVAAGTSTAIGHYDTIFTAGTAAGSATVTADAIRAQTINTVGIAGGISTARATLTSRHVVWRVVGLPSSTAPGPAMPGDWNSDFSNDFNVYMPSTTTVSIKTMWKVA